MNQTIQTLTKLLLSIYMAMIMTSCISTNKASTLDQSIKNNSRVETVIFTEPVQQMSLSSTQTPLRTDIAQTESLDSLTNSIEESFLENDHMCIGPFSEFAYSGIIERQSHSQQSVLPLAPWENVIDFSIKTNNDENYYLALARQYKNEVEIWIDDYTIDRIIIFKPETQEQQEISSGQIDYPGMTTSPAFIQSDGTVWGQNYVYGENNEILYDPYPPLSKFNEETRQFEIPKGMFTISLYQEYMEYRKDPLIFLDENDIFWVFSQHDGLYQYDTSTGKTKKILETPNLAFRNGALDQQGGIYFNRPILGYPTEELPSDEIYFFNSEFDILELISTPAQKWPAVADLYVDTQGRLWTDISGYRDLDGKWILLHKNIGEYFSKGFGKASWYVPSIETQTSDGRFWIQREYSDYNDGTAWFDAESGEGCWFTSYTSRIVEDANNTLWFEADGKLYKNELQP